MLSPTFCSVDPPAVVTPCLAYPPQDPLPLTYLDPSKLPPGVKLPPLLWNCPNDCPLFPFFGRGGLLVKNLKSLLLAPVA